MYIYIYIYIYNFLITEVLIFMKQLPPNFASGNDEKLSKYEWSKNIV